MRPLALVLMLAACAGPAPRFVGAERHEVTANGLRYVVWRRADAVEVHRLGPGLPRTRDVWLGAITAIQIATGCPLRPRSLVGDGAVLTGRIDCT